MQAIIMSAGKSTRTYPLTLTRPKALLPVANRPIAAHQLDVLRGLVDEVIFVVGYRAEQVREALGDRHGDITLRYVEQTEQLGTGHALLQCAPLVHGRFLAMNGDDLYAPADLVRLAALERAGLAKVVQDPRNFGVYEVDAEQRVQRLVEKPERPASRLANIGAYALGPEIFPILETLEPSERGEIEITAAIQRLAEIEGFRAVEAQGHWLAIGYPWHLLDANQFWLENFLRAEQHGDVSPRAELNGLVSVGRGAVIRAGVVIDGPVCIGEGAEIGPNCWLRPGTTVGPGARVGQGSELKNSILFENAKAPHLNYVGDSIIGAGANLGCGTVTANLRHDNGTVRSAVSGALVDSGRRKLGAIIGDGAHTGIHTSILPGRKLWPGTSTRPGEVVTRDVVGTEAG